MGGLTRLSSEMLWQAHRTEKRPLKASVLHGVHNTTATCLAYSPPFLFISLSFFLFFFVRDMIKDRFKHALSA